MRKAIAFLMLLDLCVSGNIYAYNFTDTDNQQIQSIIKLKENEIAQSRDIQARSIAMQKVLDSKSNDPNNSQNRILDEVYFQLWLKNSILKAGTVYCKVWELKLIDNAEKIVSDSWMKLVWVNMLCVNTSRTKVADPLGFVAMNFNSGEKSPIYTSFKQDWAIVGNVQSRFFADKALATPEFGQGVFKPMEKKSGWIIFQIDDRATRVAFGIIQGLTTPVYVKTANIARKDPKYLSESSLLCRKYESLNYSSTDCTLATMGTFKVWMPKYFVLETIGNKRESCGTYRSNGSLGNYESYCFKDESKFLKDRTYYYFLDNKLIDTSTVTP